MRSLPPHFRCHSRTVGPQVTHNYCPTWLQVRGLRDLLPTGFDDLLEWLTELRKYLSTFTSLLKDTVKETDERPREEIHSAMSGS